MHVNTLLSEMAAQFTQSAEMMASEEAKPGDVSCDICHGIELKALRSCLICVASYCEVHLKRHQTLSCLKRHKLIEPLNNLENRVCTKHNELIELFCKTDQAYLCQVCALSGHEPHVIVSLVEESEGKMTELGEMEAELQQMIQERQLKIQELRMSAHLSKEAADKEITGGTEVFASLSQLVERDLTELVVQIERKHKSTAEQVDNFIKELDQEISELIKRNAKVKQLLHSDDHFQFLHSFSLLNRTLPTKDWTKINLQQPSYEGTVERATVQLQKMLSKKIKKLLKTELRRVQEYAVDVALDPDTAHRKLFLSYDGKQVSHRDVELNVPDNPERFSYCTIVLGKQSFSSGRFYYEVQVKGKTKWDLGVVTASANRKGEIVSSPEAGYWTLQLRNGNEYIALADPDVFLSLKSQPQKVGVFVDYDEGLISFYDADSAVIIYTYTACSFREKLHPFFSPCLNDGGENSAPLSISVVQKAV